MRAAGASSFRPPAVETYVRIMGGTARTPRKPLDLPGILALDAALVEAYRRHEELRGERPAAVHIQRPAIPCILSESVVALVGLTLFDANRVEFGGKRADLRFAMVDEGELLVEVKASGGRSFIELKTRDLARDALVWADFGQRYEHGVGPIQLHVLRDPGRYVPPRAKITLNVFLGAVTRMSGYTCLRLDALEQLEQVDALQLFVRDAVPARLFTD
jgi:hypothetical protein